MKHRSLMLLLSMMMMKMETFKHWLMLSYTGNTNSGVSLKMGAMLTAGERMFNFFLAHSLQDFGNTLYVQCMETWPSHLSTETPFSVCHI